MEVRGEIEAAGKSERRKRGEGRIWQIGRTWWIQFYSRGRQIRESSHSKKFTVAERMLKRRLAEAEAGLVMSPSTKRLRYEDLRSAFLTDYRNNKRKSLYIRKSDGSEQVCGLSHLNEFFEGCRAINITTDMIRDFISKRQTEKATNATINRSLAALRGMLFLAKKDGKLRDVPHVPMLKEPAPRKGFLEHADFQRLRQVLPEHLRPVLTLGFYTGMRLGEIQALRWSNVNLFDKQIRLDPGTTKNDEQRVIPLIGELPDMLAILRQKAPQSEFVFTRDGKPLVSFRKAWISACLASDLGRLTCAACQTPLDSKRTCSTCEKKIHVSKAVYEGVIFHDLRRTGVRNLVRAGVPERVAMAVSGHKTRAVFERYNIVSERDLKDAGRALESYLSIEKGATSGQVKQNSPESRRVTN